MGEPHCSTLMSINQIESQIRMKDMKAVEVTQIIMKTTGECLSAETVEARRDLRVSTAGLVSPLPDMGICARVESYVSSGKSTGVAIFRQVLVSISISQSSFFHPAGSLFCLRLGENPRISPSLA